MRWKQKEFDEITKALAGDMDERPVKGDLTPIVHFGIAGLIEIFEEKAKTAPEKLPEAPWERYVDGPPKCECGECDGYGRIYVEGKGVKLCNARLSRSGQSGGRSIESDKAESDTDRFDLGAIFRKRG